jgi:hypothetical protein
MTHLTTISGRQFDFGSPVFHTRDIAHALSQINRYNGHTQILWSVLQHSLACWQLAPAAFKIEALLHDACEAYLCDIPTPLKTILPDYRRLEASVERTMRSHYGLPETMSAEVRLVDQQIFIAETSVFHPTLWEELGKPVPHPVALQAVRDHLLSGDRYLALMFIELVDNR